MAEVRVEATSLHPRRSPTGSGTPVPEASCVSPRGAGSSGKVAGSQKESTGDRGPKAEAEVSPIQVLAEPPSSPHFCHQR